MIAYRVHQADESLRTLLDPERADEWVASDEQRETQPYGVSAAATLDDLFRYARLYSMNVQRGDRIVEMKGRAGDEDRDQHAVRIVASCYRVMGDAADWWEAWSLDLDELAEAESLEVERNVARWLQLRLSGEGLYDASAEHRDVLKKMARKLPKLRVRRWQP